MSDAVAGTSAGASSAASSDTSAASTSTTGTASESSAGASTSTASSGRGSRGSIRKAATATVAGGSVNDFFGPSNSDAAVADKRSRRERNKATLAERASGKPETRPEQVAAVAPSDTSIDDAAQPHDNAPEQGNQYIESADDNADSGELDDDTLQLANLYGISAEEVEAYEPASLKRFIAFLERRTLAQGKESEEPAESEAEGQQATETKVTPAAAQQPAADAGKPTDAAKAAEFALEKYALALNPDDPLDAETAGQFTKLSEHYHGQLEKMLAHFSAKFEHLTGATSESDKKLSFLGDWYRQTETERQTNEYDAAFASLPEHYHAEFGTGSLNDFAADAKELAARKAIASEAERLLQLDAAAGRPRMSVAKRIKRVLAARDFDKQYEQGRQDAAEHMGRRRRQGLAQPTQRRSEAVSAEQRAKTNLKQRMAKLGVPAGRGGREVDGFFGK